MHRLPNIRSLVACTQIQKIKGGNEEMTETVNLKLAHTCYSCTPLSKKSFPVGLVGKEKASREVRNRFFPPNFYFL